MSRKTLIYRITIGCLVFLYLLNCLTPLRLHVDMLRYFAIKDCVELGCPPDSAAAKDYLPWGYTGLLLFLSKLGILKSFVLVLINCIYLFSSLYLIKKMFGDTINTFFFLLLILLNWTSLKFVMHPLSEMQYLFFSVASLYLFQRYTDTGKILFLLGSVALGGIAFLTRSVGLALAAALVTGLLWQFRKELIALIRKNRIFLSVILLAVVGIVIFSKQLGLNHYTGVFNKQFKEGVTILTIIKWHFTEWSELCFNLSIVKLIPFISYEKAKILFIVTGILFFAGFIYLLFFRKNKIPFIIKVYLLFYAVLMFNWPFYDPRFWVPVTPFVAAMIAQLSFPVKRLGRIAAAVFLAGYLLSGLASAGYLTYTSLNREVMARTHANGVYRNEYETVFFGKPVSDTAKHIDPFVLSVIQRYDR